MKCRVATVLSISGARVAGAICGYLASDSIGFRNTLGLLFGRAHLLALARGCGVYAADVQAKTADLLENENGKGLRKTWRQLSRVALSLHAHRWCGPEIRKLLDCLPAGFASIS